MSAKHNPVAALWKALVCEYSKLFTSGTYPRKKFCLVVSGKFPGVLTKKTNLFLKRSSIHAETFGVLCNRLMCF